MAARTRVDGGAYDDFGDEPRLAEGLDEDPDGPDHHHDEQHLEDEQRQGVLEGVVALPHPVGGDHRRRVADDEGRGAVFHVEPGPVHRHLLRSSSLFFSGAVGVYEDEDEDEPEEEEAGERGEEGTKKGGARGRPEKQRRGKEGGPSKMSEARRFRAPPD